jgi:hypothetical protein
MWNRFCGSNIQANFIIICGSIPYLRQFVRDYAPKWFLSRMASRQLSSSPHSTPLKMVRKHGINHLQGGIDTHTYEMDEFMAYIQALFHEPRRAARSRCTLFSLVIVRLQI